MNEGLSELELLKIRQQQDRQQLLAAIANNAGGPVIKSHNSNNYNNESNNNISNNNNNNNFLNNQNFFKQYNKQYSETSIPSTNADPLNSNSPTPPMLTNRSFRNPFEKTTKNVSKNQNVSKPSVRNPNNNDDPNDPGTFLALNYIIKKLDFRYGMLIISRSIEP